jgi:AhpD family alkylhydroperoxidase
MSLSLQRVPSFPCKVDVYGAWGGLYDAIVEMTKAVSRSGLDRRIIELVNVRASQLNGCSHCLDRHTRAAIEHAGWEPRHLATVGAWRDTTWFTPPERAALALTDATIGVDRVPDQVITDARREFGDEGLAKLLLAIVAINCWNRVNVVARVEPVD